MVFWDSLFQPRRLPAGWVGFTDKYPAIPNIVAIAGLLWITFALAHFTSKPEEQKRAEVIGKSEIVQTGERVTTDSEPGILKSQILRLKTVYRSVFPEEIRVIVWELYRNPALYLVIPFLLLLEFLFPCNPHQPLISKGFLQDAIWFVAFGPMKILILYPIGYYFEMFFTTHRELFNIGAVAEWPVSLRIIAALLLGEFLFWCNHFVRHKVRVLWFFHAIHHSQKQTNAFTDDREHIVDAVLGSLLRFFPFFFFQIPNIYAVTVVGIYLPIHNRFIHANIKMNLGWLGYVITSPQFHRVHHSAAPEHLDKNFGAHFSVFDYLFGTACRSTNVYPETGIADSQFPFEEDLKWWQLPGNWLKQTIYPFVQVLEEQRFSNRLRMFVRYARSVRFGNLTPDARFTQSCLPKEG